jgi:hypothetical protein
MVIPSSQPKSLANYVLYETIGEGAFARCVLVVASGESRGAPLALFPAASFV